MAWSVVSKIKNALNEYTFATFPLKNYAGNAGGRFTTIYIGGSREYNDSRESQAYAEGKAIINDILSQGLDCIRGKFSFSESNYTNLDKYIYGDAGGSALRLTISVSSNAAKSFSDMAYRILNFSSVGLNGASSSYGGNDNNTETSISTFGLVINEEEQKIYYVEIILAKAYYRNDHSPAYYDSAAGFCRVWDGLSASNLWNVFKNSIPSGGGGDPYSGEDYTDPVGGFGPQDDNSETIETSPIPVAAATRSGFITAFVPTWGEIKSVASALLDPNIFQILGSSVVKLSDVVIGLSAFPCSIPANQLATVTANFLGINIGTGVQCHVADDQYLEVPCGDLDIDEYWCNCLDYNPYTSISIFLPFCGMYDLDVDEVMGKTINVTYRIDIFSGACLATIKVDGSVFYQFTGQCSSQIPVNSVSFDNFLSSMIDIGIATATGIGAVKGAGSEVAKAENNFANAKSSEAKDALDDMFAAKDNYNKVKESSASRILGAAVNSVVGGKGLYSHAGAMGGSPGFLAVRKPFIIIKRPEQVIPSTYGKFHGYPTNTTAVLGDLTGYTEVSDIRLNIPDATVDEIIECEQLLKGGVVL